MNSIEIYRDKSKHIQIDVKFENDTVWLNQAQIVELFNSSKSNISEHITSIYSSGELNKKATVRKFRTVEKEGKREVNRNIDHYNLDVIISVGYRVNSKRGIQFRKWASERLKEYLIKGYSINKKLLLQQNEKITELKNALNLISRIPVERRIEHNEAASIIDVIRHYTFSLDTLDEYDYKNVKIKKIKNKKIPRITYNEVSEVIKEIKTRFQASNLFGMEKDKSFISSISTIFQTFDRKELYPSIEEKSAMLLYLIIKNHSFVDGNKRIVASIFIWFLAKNNYLYNNDGSKKMSENELVAVCLMIASSMPKEKDIIIKIVMKLLANN